MEKKEFRCANCGRLLAKVNGDAEIKCPRCRSMNKYHDGKVDCIPSKTERGTSSVTY